jgi:alpha-D-ribose 1-methylphosphonate 5-triphosphate synthase subunit PhnH
MDLGAQFFGVGFRAGMKPAALMPADDNAADLFPRGIDLILTPGN